jgi:hypothetical protein
MNTKYARLAISQAIMDTLGELKMSYDSVNNLRLSVCVAHIVENKPEQAILVVGDQLRDISSGVSASSR